MPCHQAAEHKITSLRLEKVAILLGNVPATFLLSFWPLQFRNSGTTCARHTWVDVNVFIELEDHTVTALQPKSRTPVPESCTCRNANTTYRPMAVYESNWKMTFRIKCDTFPNTNSSGQLHSFPRATGSSVLQTSVLVGLTSVQEASHISLLQTIPVMWERERENQEKKNHTHRLIVRAAWGKTATLCLFPFFRSPLSLLSLFPVASPRAEEWRGEEPISPVLVLSCVFRAPLQRSRHLPRTPLVHSKTWNQIPDSGFLIATGPCSLRNTNPYSSYFISIICHPILLSM